MFLKLKYAIQIDVLEWSCFFEKVYSRNSINWIVTSCVSMFIFFFFLYLIFSSLRFRMCKLGWKVKSMSFQYLPNLFLNQPTICEENKQLEIFIFNTLFSARSISSLFTYQISFYFILSIYVYSSLSIRFLLTKN